MYLVLLCIVPLSGCGASGQQTYSVKGLVTVDGVPINQGDIQFIPEDTNLAPEGTRIVEGYYSGIAKPGKNKVSISALDIGPNTKYIDGSPIARNFIPERYNSATELEAIIAENDNNKVDFDLEK